MERGFLSQKGSGGGRCVKEKNVNVSNIEVVKEKDLNDEHVAMEVQSPLVDQTNAVKTSEGSYTPLPTQGTTPAENTPGKSSYANVIDESSKKAMNIRTLFTPGRGDGIDVVVPVESIRAISERFVNNGYGFFFGKRVAYPVVANYVRNTYLVKSMLNSSTGLFSFQFSFMDGLNSMLKNGPWFIRNHMLILSTWNPYVDLLKEDVGNVSVLVKLHGVLITAFNEDGLGAIATKLGEGYYTCTIRVEYEWKPPRPVPKKPTASPSGNKKKCVTHTNKVSNSNPFDVLNSVDNDEELGTNEGTTNLDNNGANSSGSYFMNVKNSSTSNTPIIDKIEKFKDLLIDGRAILVKEAGNPLKKVECSGDYDSEAEVASVGNDMARSLA
nr:hypothetical protein [Tanacetum cinerariifolium]